MSTPDAASLRIGSVHAWALAGVAVLTITGCGERSETTVPGPAAPPPSVTAVSAETAPVEQQAQFVGRVAAVNRVDLRARVPGFLKERTYTEGDQVEAGQMLFVIEPDQYQATVEQRKADVAKAIAEQQNAAAQLKRGEELLKSKNISAAEVDKLRAAESVAEAGIAQAKAALMAAELDLSYTKITAPVAGRVGLAAYTAGNLVGPDSGVLATLVSADPIYVQFPLTQRELLRARRDVAEKGGDAREVVVKLRLPDGTLYDQTGRINFVDVTTDQGTDSVTLRAEIPNPKGILVDGQFVTVVLEAGTPVSAIVIPQSALQVDQQGVFVLVVEDGKAEVRRITTGAHQGSRIAVTEGLKTGDLVITEGVQKVRPGQPVKAAPPEAVGVPTGVEAGTAPTENAAAASGGEGK